MLEEIRRDTTTLVLSVIRDESSLWLERFGDFLHRILADYV